MKTRFFLILSAVLAFSMSANANEDREFRQENEVIEIAGGLDADMAYNYTLLCQKFISEAKNVMSSEKMTAFQKENRLEMLKSVYTERFSEILDSWQTMVTIAGLSDMLKNK